MKPFRIVTVNDEITHVPFELPVKGRRPLQFSIPRLNFMSEQQARAVRDRLKDIDKPVPLFDPQSDEPVYELGEDGNPVLIDGEPRQLEGPQPRTPMERTRVTALAMLVPLVPDPVGEVLESLTAGELEQIVDHWTTVSGTKIAGNSEDPEATDLGESSASSTS